MPGRLLTDLGLARRLERAEGSTNARFVEARARLAPDLGATWIEVAGAYAMYDGPRSPCTQTFGLGLFQMPTEADMAKLEAFFEDRGAPVFHEISPLADKELLPLLASRGYTPVELTSVMFLELAGRAPVAMAVKPELRVRVATGAEDREVWVQTGADGWREHPGFEELHLDLLRASAGREGSVPFLAEWNDIPIAAGALAIHEGVGLFAGAATVPAWRRRGAQSLLLESRLAYAASAGCDLAMMGAEPGSASQRNAERQGFRIAYTRIKWGRGAQPAGGADAHAT